MKIDLDKIDFGQIMKEIEDVKEAVKECKQEHSDKGKKITFREFWTKILIQALEALVVIAQSFVFSTAVNYETYKTLKKNKELK